VRVLVDWQLLFLKPSSFGVIGFTISDSGVGYTTEPSISIVGYGQTPSVVPVIGTMQNISQILVRDAGKKIILHYHHK
jgi:hypothetical protein